MTDPIHYRPATPADAEALARLHVASWREAYAGIVPQEILDGVDMAGRIARWREHLGQDGITFVAAAGGELAGFIRAAAPEEPLVAGADGHIFALYILRRHARQGIGRQLLARAAAAWDGRGGRALSVGVLTENAPAVAFYRALGAEFARSIYVFKDLGALAAPA